MMNVLLEEYPEQTITTIPEAGLKEQLISDILLLGVQAHYRTKRCVFVEFHGHVNDLTVRVRKSTKEYQTELTCTSIMLEPYPFYDNDQRKAFEQEVIEKLQATKQHLETLLENGDIGTDNLLHIMNRTG